MAGNERSSPERIFIQVGATFDTAEAGRIRASIRQAVTASVALDFTDVRQFDDAALSELARELSDTTRPVVLRGLSERHYRLLRTTGGVR